jgi:hypothetical protein
MTHPIIAWIYGLLYLIYDHITDDRLIYVFEAGVYRLGSTYVNAPLNYLAYKTSKYSSRRCRKSYIIFTSYGYQHMPNHRFEYKGMEFFYDFTQIDKYHMRVMLTVKTYKRREEVIKMIRGFANKINHKIDLFNEKEEVIDIHRANIYS